MNLKSTLAGDLKNETRAKHRGHMPERKNRHYRPVAIKEIAFPERGIPLIRIECETLIFFKIKYKAAKRKIKGPKGLS